MCSDKKILIQVSNLTKHFPIKKGFFNKIVGHVQAVTDVSLNIYKGETLGLVGESGCGKSTAGRCILMLLPPTEGKIYFEGQNIIDVSEGRKYLSKSKDLRQKMQIIFQNPFSSLDPRMTVSDIVSEPLIIHKLVNKKDINKKTKELLDMVGISPSMLDRYPHEFSGGQRQRIGIARALSLNPKFIVADEPVSALDVSIQAQIINLMEDLKREFDLTYLFISHNLSVVQFISNRVAVMYLGEIVELASSMNLYSSPKHPYTEALMSAVPVPDPRRDISNRILLEGDVPSPENPPFGCKFHTRCRYAKDICSYQIPDFEEKEPGHFVKCHFADKLSLKGL